MKIGIIGAGNVGGALAHRFVATGHDVTISNSRGPESLTDLANETGAHAATVQGAVAGSDVVVVTIPQNKVPELPAGLFADTPEGLIVVDTGNYYPERDGRIDGIEDGMTESGWVEQQLGRPVIKAFNAIQAVHLRHAGKPAGTPGRIALAVAGDDTIAKAAVMRLIEGISFDAVDAGTIAESWRQEPGSPGYGKEYDSGSLRKALAEARHERKAEYSAKSSKIN